MHIAIISEHDLNSSKQTCNTPQSFDILEHELKFLLYKVYITISSEHDVNLSEQTGNTPKSFDHA